MTHRGPFQPRTFCESQYQQVTDEHQHRQNSTKKKKKNTKENVKLYICGTCLIAYRALFKLKQFNILRYCIKTCCGYILKCI